jgi:hypothetical protein
LEALPNSRREQRADRTTKSSQIRSEDHARLPRRDSLARTIGGEAVRKEYLVRIRDRKLRKICVEGRARKPFANLEGNT